MMVDLAVVRSVVVVAVVVIKIMVEVVSVVVILVVMVVTPTTTGKVSNDYLESVGNKKGYMLNFVPKNSGSSH